LDYLLDLFKYCALSNVVTVAQDVQNKVSQGSSLDEVVNNSANHLIVAVQAHCFVFMLTNFVRAVKSVQDNAVRDVLSKLCALFACSSILGDQQWAGILDGPQLKLARAALTELLDVLRPNAVALVDAFDIPDRVLNSVIGRYDGNVYEALFESAQKSVLNQTDPFYGYEEVLRPYLDLEILKQGNKVPKSNL